MRMLPQHAGPSGCGARSPPGRSALNTISSWPGLQPEAAPTAHLEKERALVGLRVILLRDAVPWPPDLDGLPQVGAPLRRRLRRLVSGLARGALGHVLLVPLALRAHSHAHGGHARLATTWQLAS